MNNLKQIAERLKQVKKAILSAHVMPDGDCIGSTLGMRFLLSKLGIESVVVFNDPTPKLYDFLPGVVDIRRPEDFPEGFDTAIILDATGFDRLGTQIAPRIREMDTIINIDHHISNSIFGTYNYVDSQAAATGEIVFELAKELGVTLDQEFAKYIYTSIAMDTGGFMFENTTPRSHLIVGEIMKTGINSAEINKYLFDNKELVQLKLLGYALTNLKTTADGQISWTTLPLEVIRKIGALDEHADGIVNFPRAVAGVEIGVLIREFAPDNFKVGFRSKIKVDVNILAATFGGGGHPRASGCTVTGSVQEVEDRVVNRCIQALENQ